jgi:hypothetical protein
MWRVADSKKHFRSKAKWFYEEVLSERAIQPKVPDSDENLEESESPNSPQPSDSKFLQDVGSLLQLTEEYEEDLRIAASFTATIPENAVLVRKKIADTICDLYRDPLDEKKLSVQLELPVEKLRLGFVELDTSGGGQIFGGYRSNNPTSAVDSKAPWLNHGLHASVRRAGRLFFDEDHRLDSAMGGSFATRTFFDSASEKDAEDSEFNTPAPEPSTPQPELDSPDQEPATEQAEKPIRV